MNNSLNTAVERNIDYKLFDEVDRVAYIKSLYSKPKLSSHESLFLILLNNNYEVTNTILLNIKKGGKVVSDLARIEQLIKTHSPTQLILSHNHPNSDSYPSFTDLVSTERIRTICRKHKLDIYDHIIIDTDGEYFSFKENGFLDD